VATNERNAFGSTALHLAVGTGQIAAVQLLMTAGADASLQDDNGETPADLAVAFNFMDCADALDGREPRRWVPSRECGAHDAQTRTG